MRYLLPLVTLVSALAIGSNEPQQSPPTRQPSVPSQENQQQPKVREATIPSDVSFSVIDSTTLPGIKRSLDVRLNKKVSEQILRALAFTLRAQDSRAYDRTFIAYYLPGMPVDAGAWATTHFNPNLEVRILGLTAEDENKLLTQPDLGGEIIGRWLDESPFVGSRITIFRDEGRFFIEQIFKDGSSLKNEVVERKSSLGRRFDKVDASTGDHWILDSKGNLQVRDNDGLIATAKKLEQDSR